MKRSLMYTGMGIGFLVFILSILEIRTKFISELLSRMSQKSTSNVESEIFKSQQPTDFHNEQNVKPDSRALNSNENVEQVERSNAPFHHNEESSQTTEQRRATSRTSKEHKHEQSGKVSKNVPAGWDTNTKEKRTSGPGGWGKPVTAPINVPPNWNPNSKKKRTTGPGGWGKPLPDSNNIPSGWDPNLKKKRTTGPGGWGKPLPDSNYIQPDWDPNSKIK